MNAAYQPANTSARFRMTTALSELSMSQVNG